MTVEDKHKLGELLGQLQEPINDVARLSADLVDMVQNGELVTKKVSSVCCIIYQELPLY